MCDDNDTYFTVSSPSGCVLQAYVSIPGFLKVSIDSGMGEYPKQLSLLIPKAEAEKLADFIALNMSRPSP
jgi:hypothetical protein